MSETCIRGICVECEWYCCDVEHCVHCLELVCQVCSDLHEEECEEKTLFYEEAMEREA